MCCNSNSRQALRLRWRLKDDPRRLVQGSLTTPDAPHPDRSSHLIQAAVYLWDEPTVFSASNHPLSAISASTAWWSRTRLTESCATTRGLAATASGQLDECVCGVLALCAARDRMHFRDRRESPAETGPSLLKVRSSRRAVRVPESGLLLPQIPPCDTSQVLFSATRRLVSDCAQKYFYNRA